jgi:hypothetical protein
MENGLKAAEMFLLFSSLLVMLLQGDELSDNPHAY